jgi:hypothetical protein
VHGTVVAQQGNLHLHTMLIYMIIMLFKSKPQRPRVWNRGDKVHYLDVSIEMIQYIEECSITIPWHILVTGLNGYETLKTSDLRTTSAQTAVNIGSHSKALLKLISFIQLQTQAKLALWTLAIFSNVSLSDPSSIFPRS